MRNLKDKIESFPKGYKVDLANGIVKQEIKTQQGIKVRTMRLGKVIEKDGSAEDKEIWRKQIAGYSIVVSRHPVDVLRMSDFDNIQSCHSQGGSYFKCAVAEAKGHGPIAYLVKTNDLSKIDLQADEIFADPDRDVRGINPIGRIRLRKFSHKRNDITLAIPENRVYGISGDVADNFKESLREAMLDAQKVSERPRMQDFERHGGSYADTPASTLFNNFFSDNKDIGDTSYVGQDDYQTIADQYQTEIDQITEEYKFKNPVYGSAWVDETDGHVYVYADGGVDFTINASMFIKLPGWQDYQAKREIEKNISNVAAKFYLYGVEEVDIESIKDEVRIRVRITMQDNEGNPDGFRELMSHLQEWDEKYHEVSSGIYNKLVELGYVKTPYNQQILERQPQFKNFKVEEEGNLVWIVSEPMLLGNIFNKITFGDNVTGIQEFTKQMQIIWQTEAQRQVQVSQQQQLWLFAGMEEVDIKFPVPEIVVTKIKENIFLVIQFAFHSILPHEQAKAMELHVRYLDNRINVLHQYAVNLFEKLVLQPNK